MKLETYNIGRYAWAPSEPDLIDSRGILWMWEPPQRTCQYVIGCDPTMGISQWNRQLRTKDDTDVDNAVIEVFRVGARTSRGKEKDVQVAEWAAPVDPYDLAEYVNSIGRMYAGNDEEGTALACIEVYPGPGWQTQQELSHRFGYMNFPPWAVASGLTMRYQGNKFGWFSNRSTRVDLWTRGTSHLQRDGAMLRSPWLVEEMADCTPDNFLAMTARARSGLHDDRVVATLIALWFCNEWSLAIEPTEPNAAESLEGPKWQAAPISAASMFDEWNDRVSSLLSDND